MSYKIFRTDGSLLADVIDSSLDQVSTDLTLIGKNTSNFGSYLNENFVKLLENFANTSSPNNPTTGQIWYDTNELRLKVYTGQQWKQTSGPIVSGTPPLVASLTQGDFWIDSAENQLWMYDGEEGLKLVGPGYKASQGISGFETRTINDANNVERVILVLWLGSSILGIFSSSATDFSIPDGVFPQGIINNPIKPGFNVCNVPVGGQTALKFNVTATKADNLVYSDGSLLDADTVLRNDIDNNALGPIRIRNNTVLYLGPLDEVRVNVNSAGLSIVSNAMPQQRVGIFQPVPQYSLDIDGSLRASKMFKLPTFTTLQRDNRDSSIPFEDGEMIYNLTVNKVQARANGAWVDLH